MVVYKTVKLVKISENKEIVINSMIFHFFKLWIQCNMSFKEHISVLVFLIHTDGAVEVHKAKKKKTPTVKNLVCVLLFGTWGLKTNLFYRHHKFVNLFPYLNLLCLTSCVISTVFKV